MRVSTFGSFVLQSSAEITCSTVQFLSLPRAALLSFAPPKLAYGQTQGEVVTHSAEFDIRQGVSYFLLICFVCRYWLYQLKPKLRLNQTSWLG